MATRSRDFESAEQVRERNRQILHAVRECRALSEEADRLLERAHRRDRSASNWTG